MPNIIIIILTRSNGKQYGHTRIRTTLYLFHRQVDKLVQVYKCTAPEKLLAVEGGVVTELPDGAKISCQ